LLLALSCSCAAFWTSGCAGVVKSAGNGGNPPPVTLSLSATSSSGITSNGATISWMTNVGATSQVNYGTTASYGQSSALNSSLVTSHSVALTGLTASTLYHFQVTSADASNNQAASGDFTFTTTAALTPLTISAVVAGNITSSGATITWTTNVGATSQVSYGTTATYGQSSALNSSLVTSHSVALTGLTASTLYHFQVKSADASNNQAASGDFTFTTTAALTPLTISAVVAGNITSSGATITWTTNVGATSQVNYGTTASYGQSSALDSSLVTSHSVALTGLTASTLYHFQVKSADASNNQAASGDFTFTTTAGQTSGPLTVNVTAPAQGATVGGTVGVTASASDNVTIIGVQYQLDGLNIGPLFREAPYTFFWDTSLASNGSHSLTALATDVSGNSATSSSVSLTISNNSSTVVNLSPSNWCGTINGGAPGTTFVLAPGSYTDSCHVTASGTAAAPITIRSQGSTAGSQALLVYNGTVSNIIDLGGSYIALRWLSLGPSQDGVDGIRIRGTHDDVIESNTFQGIGGVGVPNNDSGGNTPRITVRNNTFTNGQSTVIYIGCHNGSDCHSPDVLIEGNLISGALPGDGVGGGVQIKLNSYGTVRDNTIYNTTGAGIIIYGSSEGDPASVVEGNYVQGAQQDAGINASGGAVIVRNNVVVGNANFGIWAQDYNGRNLQSNVWFVNNTVLNNQGGGIGVQNWQAGRGNVMAFNAITPLTGTSAYDPSVPATLTGNITCSPAASCFDQPTNAPYDLWPVSGGPLIRAAGNATEPWNVFDDFMGVLRLNAADAGAFQRTGTGNGPTVGGGSARPPRQ
jgi:parallel beta-helix repeat protein